MRPWHVSIATGNGKLIRKAFDWVADDPWRLFVIGSAVLAVLWWRADARADRLQGDLTDLREASERVADADKAADQKASDVAAQTKGKVEDGNERARAAASGSDDPLKRGLDSLRGENSRSDEEIGRASCRERVCQYV